MIIIEHTLAIHCLGVPRGLKLAMEKSHARHPSSAPPHHCFRSEPRKRPLLKVPQPKLQTHKGVSQTSKGQAVGKVVGMRKEAEGGEGRQNKALPHSPRLLDGGEFNKPSCLRTKDHGTLVGQDPEDK